MQNSQLAYFKKSRALAAVSLSPALVVAFLICGSAAQGRIALDPAALVASARSWMLASYFLEIVIFLPVFVFLRRYADVTAPERVTLLGAYAGWVGPVAYMLLMTIWRGDLLNVLVLDVSAYLLSPANAFIGALGGLIFWMIAAAPAPLTPRQTIRVFLSGAAAPVATQARGCTDGELP